MKRYIAAGVLCVLLTASAVHAQTTPYRPGGLTYIHPVSAPQSDVTEWLIGRVVAVGGAALATTKVLETQAPGCMAGPCPDALIVIFQNGSVQSFANPAYVRQIAQVDPRHYLAVSGFCELAYPHGCRLRVYAIDTIAERVKRIFIGDAASTKQALCGLTVGYRGQTYTIRVVPTDQYNGEPHLTLGVNTCG